MNSSIAAVTFIMGVGSGLSSAMKVACHGGGLTVVPHRRSSTDLQIRRFLCGHPDPFRTVRDLGRVFARCSRESEVSEDGSFRWLPAWLPGGKVHSSGGRRSESADCGVDLAGHTPVRALLRRSFRACSGSWPTAFPC
jgi:hypothetical protein